MQADGGGLSRILVADDGAGPGACRSCRWRVERHATSKLAPGADGAFDLLRIATLGFRGEALPSIGSVARLALAARTGAAPPTRSPSRATPARSAASARPPSPARTERASRCATSSTPRRRG